MDADRVVVAPPIVVRADLDTSDATPQVVVRASDDGAVGYLLVPVGASGQVSLAVRTRKQARALAAAVAELEAALHD